MSDFDINVCESYTDLILSILDLSWHGEAIAVGEDGRTLPAGVLLRVFEDNFPTAEPIKNDAALKQAEFVNSTLRAWGFAPLDGPGSVMRYRCPGSRNYVAVCVTEEGIAGKENAA